MSYSTTVIRRWNSAPLDPTPPSVVRSELDPMLLPPIYDESSRTINTDMVDASNDTTHHTTDDVVLVSSSTAESEKKGATATTTTTTTSQSIAKGGDSKGNINIKEGQRGRGWGRGIVIDFNNTIRKYWLSEMSNLNQKTIAVSFFLFFACISPAITFGAVYGKATHNHIGAVEMLIATSWCGIIYSLIGGQPMMINGGTGPVLAFTEIIYQMSLSMDVPFLTFNAWIGLWICFYMCIAAVGSLNRIIAYATRFTDEIFALLISTIFIINALYNPFNPTGVFYYFQEDHKSHEEHSDNPDYSITATALLSLIVCLGTVQVAFALRKVKFSPFLPTQGLRNTITDFAVVTSILIWTLIAGLAFSHVPLETLNVPDTVAPTFACCTEACDLSWPEDCPDITEPYGRRSWFVDLTDLNGNSWVPFAAAGPAFLAFILVFLDDGITWHLINHPAHKLTHGEAFDYDTVIIGLMAAINGLFGLPILVAATVRSLNHVHALAEKTADGRILSVQETRLTHLFIHGLCLASLFVLEVLKLIPMPVLYGVFLFMGLVSLGSNTLWNRFLMFFMQPSKFPLEPYTLHMRPRRMHLFTAIQLGLFALLYTVKAIKTIAILFPLIIAMCIPIRLYILPRIFTEKELVVIDSDDDTIKKWLAAHQIDVDEDEDDEDIKKDHDQGEEVERDQTEGRRREKQLSHHAGEDNEFFVKDLIEDNKENNVGEGILIDLEKGEEVDKVHPLPPEEAIRNREPKGRPSSTRRRNRKKSLSCPTTHLMFAETPHGIVPEIGLADHVVSMESTTTQSEEGESRTSGGGGGGGQQAGGSSSSPPVVVAPRPRRSRRAKSLSCPTHLLYAEADRHVAENYFFG